MTDIDRTVVEGHWHDSVPRDILLINGSAGRSLAVVGWVLNFSVTSPALRPRPRGTSTQGGTGT